MTDGEQRLADMLDAARRQRDAMANDAMIMAAELAAARRGAAALEAEIAELRKRLADSTARPAEDDSVLAGD